MDSDVIPIGTLVRNYNVPTECVGPKPHALGLVIQVSRTDPERLPFVGQYNYGVKVLWVEKANTSVTWELPWHVSVLRGARHVR